MEEDIYNNLGATNESVDLMAELAPPETVNKTPVSAIRNRAAALSLMSNGSVVENYQDTVQAIKDNRLEQTRVFSEFHDGVRTDTLQGSMAVLASPEYSFEEKSRMVQAAGVKAPEINTKLAERMLVSDSPGETPDQETVRVNTVDVLDNMIRTRQEAQSIVNAHLASLDPDMTKGFFDFLASDILPFGNNVMQARIAKARGAGLWGTLRAFILAGSDAADMQEAYANIDPSREVELAHKYLDIVGNNAGVLFGKDNHYAQHMKVRAMLSGELPSRTGEILENLAPLLDIFGLRAEYKAGKLFLQGRRVEAASRAARSIPAERVDPLHREMAPAVRTAPAASSRAPDESLLSKSPQGPDAAMARSRQEVAAMEAEKARLLEDQNLAGRGDIRNLEAQRAALRAPDVDAKTLADSIKKANPRMSSKDARSEAQKRIDDEMADFNSKMDRIESQIRANRDASGTAQRIADLENKIVALSKGVPENAGSVLTRLSDEISRIEWNNTIRYDNPISVGNIVGATNPARARTLFAASLMDDAGETVKAVYGSERADAIAANVFPQAVSESGVVTTKAPDIQRELYNNPEIQKKMSPTGLIFTPEELSRADANIAKKFSEISGLYINDAMGGLKMNRDGVGTQVTAVYGTSEGGFLTARQALDQTLFALKESGAKAEDIEILARDGMNHRPVKIEDVGDTPGEYYARLSMPYETKADDVGFFDEEDVKWNALDNINTLMGNQYTGSLTRNLVDIASMFSPRFSGAAIRTSDIAAGLDKLLIDEVKIFTDKFDKLSSARKKKLHDYLKEANLKQIKDSQADLVARGFTPHEMDTIKSFRNFWDTHYYLENSDFTRTLNADGWKILQHPTERFVAKELQPNQWDEVNEFLDPRTGNIEVFDSAMRVNINNVNGQLAVLRRPTMINGREVKHIFVDNNPNSYLRTVRDTDQVLSKLDGYYTVYYKVSRFVDRVTYDGTGPNAKVIRRQAVAVAGDWKTAEDFAKRQITTGNEKYIVRGDERAMRVGSDDWFDVNNVQGRISQRHRGQALDEAGSGPAILGDESFVLSPVDAAVRASRSIAGRVAARPMLENAKARFVQQYRHVIDPDKFGEYNFPSGLDKIGQKGIASTPEMASARSTWEMINYLEKGYINAADTVVKQMFNVGAIMAGKSGYSKIERALGKASEVAPVAALKGTIFNTLVGTSIFRNWVVQTFQLTRLPAYNLFGTGTTIKNVMSYMHDAATGTKGDFTKFVEDSNLMATVDRHNLTRGSIQNAMDHSSKVMNTLYKPVEFARMIGFDMAEQTNLLGHLAAVYDKFKRQGKDMSNWRVRQEAFVEVRHLTGNMNRAADMPYNQTALSLATQFLQAPHKMLLQYTNRALPWQDRLKLFAWDTFFWGVPSALVYNSIVEEEIPEPELRKIMVDGAMTHMLNAVLKAHLKTDKEIDISSLNPTDIAGLLHLYEAVVTGGTDELMTNTPAGSLFGEQGRFQQAIRTWSQLFKGGYDDEMNPVEFTTAFTESAKILPLVNNAYKAAMIVEYNERRNAKNFITEEDVPDAYAYFQMFGFGSKNLSDLYKASKELTKHTKEQEDNLYKVYRHSMGVMAAVNDESMSDLHTRSRTVNALLAPYKDQPWAKKKLVEWLSRDMKGQDLNTSLRLMRLSGLPDDGTIRRDIERLPNITPERKAQAIRMLQDAKTTFENEEE